MIESYNAIISDKKIKYVISFKQIIITQYNKTK